LKIQARQLLAEWFDNTDDHAAIGEGFRARVANYEFQKHDGTPIERNAIGAGIEFDWQANNWQQVTGAGTCTLSNAQTTQCNRRRAISRPLVGTKGNGEAFLLSTTEVALYFTADNRGANSAWTLRSPSSDILAQFRSVSANGEFGNTNTQFSNDTKMRPAVWIHR